MRNDKRTWAIWAMQGLILLNVALESWALVAMVVTQRPIFPRNDIVNAIAIAMVAIDILLSAVFFVKLKDMADDLHVWTNIVFGYALLLQAYATFMDKFAAVPWALLSPNIIELSLIVLAWVLFSKHLKRFRSKPHQY